SCAPVEAPEGTAARPIEPSSSTTSTSTVGLPRLSRISRPMMSTMAVISRSLFQSIEYSVRHSRCAAKGNALRQPGKPRNSVEPAAAALDRFGRARRQRGSRTVRAVVAHADHPIGVGGPRAGLERLDHRAGFAGTGAHAGLAIDG